MADASACRSGAASNAPSDSPDEGAVPAAPAMQPEWLLQGAAELLAGCVSQAQQCEGADEGDAPGTYASRILAVECRVGVVSTIRGSIQQGRPSLTIQVHMCCSTAMPLLHLHHTFELCFTCGVSSLTLQVRLELGRAQMANSNHSAAASTAALVRSSEQHLDPQTTTAAVALAVRVALAMGHAEEAAEHLLTWIGSDGCLGPALVRGPLAAYMEGAAGQTTQQASHVAGLRRAVEAAVQRFPGGRAAVATLVVTWLLGAQVRMHTCARRAGLRACASRGDLMLYLLLSSASAVPRTEVPA
jgi:hypothetical protein